MERKRAREKEGKSETLLGIHSSHALPFFLCLRHLGERESVCVYVCV
jgi:hypothetical protein